MGSRLRRTRIRKALRSTRTRAALALGAVAVLAVSGTSASWSDTVPISGTTVTALTVPAATNLACVLSNNNGSGFTSLVVTATVPAGSQVSYSLQLVHHLNPADGATFNLTGTPTISGTTLTYTFQSGDISQDAAANNSNHVDYFLNITGTLVSDPSWTSTVAQITFDATNAPGGIGGIGGGIFYGSPIGTPSPNGVPGACSTA